jgi:CYTH domain-containing protein
MVTWARENGWVPLIVPEAATHLMTAGLMPMLPQFQKEVLHHVLQTEKSFDRYAFDLARQGQKPVLICDRGLWDQCAYMEEESFVALCADQGVHAYTAKGDRYDGVIFMRSAAVGAEDFYSKAGNQHRYESAEEARVLDERTRDAWTGVSHLCIIDNPAGGTFDEKVRRAVSDFAKQLGVPEPMEMERKFKVVNFNARVLPKHTVASEIVQDYLVGVPNLVERVRARSYSDQWVYTHTIKEFVKLGVAIERERIVTRAQYEDLLVRVDRERATIYKTRYCFIVGNHHCELDVFKKKRAGEVVLEIEVSNLDDQVQLPAFLEIAGEITDDPASSNYQMALAV